MSNIELGLYPMDILVECLSLRCRELVGDCRIKFEVRVNCHVILARAVRIIKVVPNQQNLRIRSLSDVVINAK